MDPFPVGFRFNPTDEELLHHYLKNKLSGNESLVRYIRQIDICKCEPWDIPGQVNDDTGIDEWFFFSALDIKYPKSLRCNRATESGFWKSTGKDRKIMARGTKKQIGTKKTLVFRRGRVPDEEMTNWVIHEYHLLPDINFPDQRPFVICRLKKNPDANLSKYDKSNGLVNSTFENVSTVNRIQEAFMSPKQPANASDDSGVNRQSISIQPEAAESYSNLFSDYQFSQDDTTSDWGTFPLRPEPDLISFQPANGDDDEVYNQPLLSGPFESELNVMDYFNSVSEYENESYLSEELRGRPEILQLQASRGTSDDQYVRYQAGRISWDTSDIETIVGLANDISDYLSLTQEFFRRRRTVSRIASRFAKYREENKIDSVEVWQSRFVKALQVIKPFFYLFLLFLCFCCCVFMCIQFSLNTLRRIARDNRVALLITLLLFQPLIFIVY